MSTRLVSRLSTLDAAKAVFFLIVGFAVKQSLGLFGHAWPSKDFPSAPNWPLWARAIIAAGYLFTVIRFSHGVTLLYGHEKQRIEKSKLPSASKISELSLFLVLLAIPLYLMADNIVETNSYITWTAIMIGTDFVYILRSEVVRNPIKRIFRLFKETDRASAAHAAFWWIVTDVALFVVCSLFFVKSSLTPLLASYPPAREILFASVLILAAKADYWLNWDFYFGGRKDRRTQKFVFVISPLRNSEADLYKDNINRAQWYCLTLMNWRGRFGKKITPLASHAFFTYFLNDGVREDRALGVECTLAYLSACDAVYVYVPATATDLKPLFENAFVRWGCAKLGLAESLEEGGMRRLVEKLEKENLTKGMRYALDTARTHGLEIRYLKEASSLPLPAQWFPPDWKGITYERELPRKKPSQSYFQGAAQRKKVYVCTSFRGTGFDEKNWSDKIDKLKTNTRLALWHCHQLVRDPDEAVAPFAPQAFYPYFWKFTANNEIDLTRWNDWFERSIEILKVCDAVYIYTKEGLPPTEEDCSKGVRLVNETALKLGLEIQYRRELELPEEERISAQKNLDRANVFEQQAITELAVAESELKSLEKIAKLHAAEFGDGHDQTREARERAASAKQVATSKRERVDAATQEVKSETAKLQRYTWDPAVPRF